jgi:hypothetical protein
MFVPFVGDAICPSAVNTAKIATLDMGEEVAAPALVVIVPYKHFVKWLEIVFFLYFKSRPVPVVSGREQ